MQSSSYLIMAALFGAGLLGGTVLGMRLQQRGRTARRGKVRIGPSSVAGRGAHATAHIAEGEIIERCPAIEVKDKDIGGELLNYVFYGSEEQSRLVAMGYGMLFNHSFEPNVAYYLEEAATGPELVLYATRPIKRGEELFYNYGKEWWDTRQ